MTNLEQRIHDLPPERFARSAHAAAALAIRAAELAGKEPPASAVWLKSQSSEQLSAQQQQRLQDEAEVPRGVAVPVESYLLEAEAESADDAPVLPAAVLLEPLFARDAPRGSGITVAGHAETASRENVSQGNEQIVILYKPDWSGDVQMLKLPMRKANPSEAVAKLGANLKKTPSAKRSFTGKRPRRTD